MHLLPIVLSLLTFGNAEVLFGQHYNKTGTSCMEGEATDWPNVMPSYASSETDCNYKPHGESQQLLQPALSTGRNQIVHFHQKHEPINSGTWVWKGEFTMIEQGLDRTYSPLMLATLGNRAWSSYPRLHLMNNPNARRFQLRCNDWYDTWSSSAFQLWGDGVKRSLEVEWHFDDGPGRCEGLTEGCTLCGCLWVDGIQEAQCDSPRHSPAIDGFSLINFKECHDIAWDNTYVCDGPNCELE